MALVAGMFSLDVVGSGLSRLEPTLADLLNIDILLIRREDDDDGEHEPSVVNQNDKFMLICFTEYKFLSKIFHFAEILIQMYKSGLNFIGSLPSVFFFSVRHLSVLCDLSFFHLRHNGQ